MAKKERSAAKGSEKVSQKSATVVVSKRGIRVGTDFADLMAALLTDLPSNLIAPNVANAMCNAGGKLLKIVEMQHKYGGGKPLRLAGPPTA